jgi:hypothetical protein
MRDSSTIEKADTPFRRWIAPGTQRIQKFAIKMDSSPEQGTVRINWQSFKASESVQKQIAAAAKLGTANKISAVKS